MVALALVSFIKYYRIILCMILDYCDNNNKQSVGPSRKSDRLQPLVGASAALQRRDPTSAQRRTSHGKSSSHAAADSPPELSHHRASACIKRKT